MSRKAPLRAPARLALALVLATGAVAPASQRFDVGLIEPIPGISTFGVIDVVADVRGTDEAVRVEFYYNGEKVGEVDGPPYRFQVDTGQRNVERTFRVVAHGPNGATSSAELTLPAIAVHEELDLGLRQLYVTVKRGSARVPDLAREQFEVLDLKLRQDLVTFERGDVPFTSVVLIDSSLSMAGDPLATAIAGALGFAGSLHDLDEASIVLFSDRILAETPFGNDPEALRVPLANVEPAGGSAILDHTFLAMARLEQRQGRRMILLLSDGVDVESFLSVDDLSQALNRASAMLYWLRLPSEIGHISSWKTQAENAAQRLALEQLVADTGGSVLELSSAEDTGGALASVLAEIRGQYVLGYYPKVAIGDGRWHDIDVRVDAPGATVTTRRGYFDD